MSSAREGERERGAAVCGRSALKRLGLPNARAGENERKRGGGISRTLSPGGKNPATGPMSGSEEMQDKVIVQEVDGAAVARKGKSSTCPHEVVGRAISFPGVPRGCWESVGGQAAPANWAAEGLPSASLSARRKRASSAPFGTKTLGNTRGVGEEVKFGRNGFGEMYGNASSSLLGTGGQSSAHCSGGRLFGWLHVQGPPSPTLSQLFHASRREVRDPIVCAHSAARSGLARCFNPSQMGRRCCACSRRAEAQENVQRKSKNRSRRRPTAALRGNLSEGLLCISAEHDIVADGMDTLHVLIRIYKDAWIDALEGV